MSTVDKLQDDAQALGTQKYWYSNKENCVYFCSALSQPRNLLGAFDELINEVV
jgi:hypothetical protein